MIEFWYEFASTYSYPAAMRVQLLADAASVAVRWRPFLLGPIFGSQGWNDSPFNMYPAKGAYMWHDLQRICAKEGLPLKLPPFCFPQNGLKAARLALVGGKEGWIGAFSRAVYTANFGEERNITDEELLRSLVKRGRRCRCGVDASEHAGDQGRVESADRRSYQARDLRRAELYDRRRTVLGQRPAGRCGRVGEALITTSRRRRG
jgi:2-hydroxychromene-2-carboxylate isomerase